MSKSKIKKGYCFKNSPLRKIVTNIEKGHCQKKSPPRRAFKENPEQVATRRRGSSILEKVKTQITEILIFLILEMAKWKFSLEKFHVVFSCSAVAVLCVDQW